MKTLAAEQERFAYDLPIELEATEPPEARGLTHDGVRMLVTRVHDRELEDSSFVWLPSYLSAGDLLIINVSGTIPAAIDTSAPDGTALVVHLSTELDDGRWAVEPRRSTAGVTSRWDEPFPYQQVELAGGATLTFDEPYEGSTRLWTARFDVDLPILTWLAIHGRPIRYGYVERRWPIEAYQNVYATDPGSAEMPSAGRAFTPQMITRLVAKGIGITPVTLHTGVASLEADEFPYSEHFEVEAATAERVNLARSTGHRVIAVGTTAVRAIESSVSSDGTSHPISGWTNLVVTPDRGVKLVDGLLTGWHEPESSHLLMLEAFLDRGLLRASYEQALANRYRWHEFGDLHLVVPE